MTDRRISGRTRLAAVIGSPIRHSLSPAIFNAAFAEADLDWVYVAFDVAVGDATRAIDAMRVLGLGGLSVTMPHKDSVAELVDQCTPEAAALRAVNCVVPTVDGLVGENTDGPGFLDAIDNEVGFEVTGRRVVVVGAGGAARAIVLALARAGAAEVVVVNRTAAKAQAAAALAEASGRVGEASEITGADLVVNATSVGMGDGRTPFAPDLLRPGQVLADIVYHPSPTPLLAAARDRGVTAVDGLGMLVHQAAHAFRLWTGQEPPIAAMTNAARRELAERT
ncbi:MAG TPA: shikimate dehydrogenase [Acidimicrobiales bacterium]|nr:shikimate dehydrogenase [Acidimicrobiales bacterium]